jgi:hypothetical protein
MTIVLSGTNGIQNVLGSAASPAESNTTSSNTGVYFPTSTTLGFSTAGTNAVYIDASQNVGIGQSTPTVKLDVNGATNFGGTSGVRCGIGTAFVGGQAEVYSQGAVPLGIGTASTQLVRFYTNSTLAATIDASQNLLVGTTDNGLYTGAGIKFLPAGGGASIPYISQVGANSSDSNVTYRLYSTTAGAYRFYVGYGGTIFATSIVITAISDQRLKENVRDIDTGLNAILSLKPRRFDWKEGKGQNKKNVAGFIAQEFEEVFPECVGVSQAGEDGIEYKNINHETLIPTLVKAIQEQQTLITQLTDRIAALEAK